MLMNINNLIRINNQIIRFIDRYTVVVNSKDLKYIRYDIQKKQNDFKNNNGEKHGILDQAKQKALEVKDTVVDSTKELSNEQKYE